MAHIGDDDPLAPVFFLSYALPASGRSRVAGAEPANVHVRRFFEDLSGHVGELLGSAVGEYPGYLEPAAGTTWGAEVSAAAGTCHVFVPLISRHYLDSAGCAQEWDIFARRPVVPRPGGPRGEYTAVLPIAWSPTVHHELPSAIREVQFFSPDTQGRTADPSVARRYQDEGVYGLLASHDEPAYQAVVWWLARAIVDVYHSFRVPPRIPVDAAELRGSFPGDGE